MAEVTINGITYKDEQIEEEIVLTASEIENLTQKLELLKGAKDE